ncbi:MAG: preprotein translocase subunit SecG [Candidatus Omnitrophota bacterium]
MMAFIIAIHVIACIVLIGLVLIQRGRGGGLVESFSGVESMFGTKTSVFLTRTTTILSIMFFITCLSLAFLSIRQSKSLMSNVKDKVEDIEGALPIEEANMPTEPDEQATEEATESMKKGEEAAGDVTKQAESVPSSEQKVEPPAE